MKKVEILQERRLLDAFFKVDEVQLCRQRFDGSMSPPLNRLCFERGDGVAALLHQREAGRMVLVRQFRYPAWVREGPGWILEIVAGMLDEDEAPEETMRREILEETGYQVAALEYISTFYLSPGGSSERIFLYYAEVEPGDQLNRGGGLEKENEDIEIVELPIEEAFAALDWGEIADAKTLVALMWFRGQQAKT